MRLAEGWVVGGPIGTEQATCLTPCRLMILRARL